LTVVNKSRLIAPSQLVQIPPTVSAILNHPQRHTIRLQLKQNLMLREIPVSAWDDLEPQLEIAEYRKGEPLVRQGSTSMEQFFILDGILKRVVSNPQGKEMILRFAAETDMDTSYAAWRMKTPIPYSIAAVTKVRVARLSMPHWVEFLERHIEVKLRFEYEVMRLMSRFICSTPPGALRASCASIRTCSAAYPKKSWLPISISPRRHFPASGNESPKASSLFPAPGATPL